MYLYLHDSPAPGLYAILCSRARPGGLQATGLSLLWAEIGLRWGGGGEGGGGDGCGGGGGGGLVDEVRGLTYSWLYL